jgi:hypothetical protein
MIEFGLSLIGFQDISQSRLEVIRAAGFTKLTLVPSHLGYFNSSGNSQGVTDSMILQMQRLGLRIHSIQGLLFGVELGNGGENLFIAEERLKQLFEIARKNDVEYLILGAPNFRKDSLCWERIITFASLCEEKFEVRLVIENICDEKSDTGIHFPWSDSQIAAKKETVLDIGNALDCIQGRPLIEHSTNRLDFCQVSARFHKLPKGDDEVLEISSALRLQTNLKLAIWEIMGISLEEACEQLPRIQETILMQLNNNH